MEIMERKEVHLLQLRAEREFATFIVTPAILGERVEREFKLVEEEILPVLDRTPSDRLTRVPPGESLSGSLPRMGGIHRVPLR